MLSHTESEREIHIAATGDLMEADKTHWLGIKK